MNIKYTMPLTDSKKNLIVKRGDKEREHTLKDSYRLSLPTHPNTDHQIMSSMKTNNCTEYTVSVI